MPLSSAAQAVVAATSRRAPVVKSDGVSRAGSRAGFGQWVTVIQGVIFVTCVLTFRRGLIGEVAHYIRSSL